jgi:methionine synthase II (cobalamin-independent)
VKLKAQKLEQSAQALEQIPPGTDWVTWAESALEDLEKKSAEQVSDIVNDALEKAKDHFGQVIQRTESLIGLNPSIDQKELHMLQNREKQVLKGMESTHIKVDAIRLIFCTGTGQ